MRFLFFLFIPLFAFASQAPNPDTDPCGWALYFIGNVSFTDQKNFPDILRLEKILNSARDTETEKGSVRPISLDVRPGAREFVLTHNRIPKEHWKYYDEAGVFRYASEFTNQVPV